MEEQTQQHGNQNRGQEIGTVAVLRQLIRTMFNEYAQKNKEELISLKNEAITLNELTRKAFEEFQRKQQKAQDSVDDEQNKKLESIQKQMGEIKALQGGPQANSLEAEIKQFKEDVTATLQSYQKQMEQWSNNENKRESQSKQNDTEQMQKLRVDFKTLQDEINRHWYLKIEQLHQQYADFEKQTKWTIQKAAELDKRFDATQKRAEAELNAVRDQLKQLQQAERPDKPGQKGDQTTRKALDGFRQELKALQVRVEKGSAIKQKQPEKPQPAFQSTDGESLKAIEELKQIQEQIDMQQDLKIEQLQKFTDKLDHDTNEALAQMRKEQSDFLQKMQNLGSAQTDKEHHQEVIVEHSSANELKKQIKEIQHQVQKLTSTKAKDQGEKDLEQAMIQPMIQDLRNGQAKFEESINTRFQNIQRLFDRLESDTNRAINGLKHEHSQILTRIDANVQAETSPRTVTVSEQQSMQEMDNKIQTLQKKVDQLQDTKIEPLEKQVHTLRQNIPWNVDKESGSGQHQVKTIRQNSPWRIGEDKGQILDRTGFADMVSTKTVLHFPPQYRPERIVVQDPMGTNGSVKEDLPLQLIEQVIELASIEFGKLTKSVDQRLQKEINELLQQQSTMQQSLVKVIEDQAACIIDCQKLHDSIQYLNRLQQERQSTVGLQDYGISPLSPNLDKHTLLKSIDSQQLENMERMYNKSLKKRTSVSILSEHFENNPNSGIGSEIQSAKKMKRHNSVSKKQKEAANLYSRPVLGVRFPLLQSPRHKAEKSLLQQYEPAAGVAVSNNSKPVFLGGSAILMQRQQPDGYSADLPKVNLQN